MPLLVLLILKGGTGLFTLLTMLLSFLGLHEYGRMMLKDRPAFSIAFAGAGSLLPLTALSHHPAAIMLGVLILFFLASLHFLFRHGDIAQVASSWALSAAGILYVPLLITHILLLRLFPHGVAWVFLLLFIVMCSDTFAYYIGCRFGRHRLYPTVSPNKSVEGAAGGLAGAFVGTFIAANTFFPQLTVGDCLATALAAGVMAQVGDLFESLLKRSAGVKDSGSLIPGHGGILDRLDSVIFAAPVLYYYALFIFYGQTGF